MNLLELVDISYIYHSLDGETEAIKEVNLTVREGEFTAIVGPSGSGKTTLLKIMAGLIAPSKGSIEKPKDVRVSYMPQRDQLFEWRSILKNVTLSAEIGKHDRAAARRVFAPRPRIFVTFEYGRAILGDQRLADSVRPVRQPHIIPPRTRPCALRRPLLLFLVLTLLSSVRKTSLHPL